MLREHVIALLCDLQPGGPGYWFWDFLLLDKLISPHVPETGLPRTLYQSFFLIAFGISFYKV